MQLRSASLKRAAPDAAELDESAVKKKLQENWKPRELTEAEKQLRKEVWRRRVLRRKVNHTNILRKGYAVSIQAFETIKRIQNEKDDVNANLESMIETVRTLQAKMKGKLQQRELDIANGNVDPDEPVGKEKAMKMKEWVQVVPSLIAFYNEKKGTNWAVENNMANVFHLGVAGAVPPAEDSGSESELDSGVSDSDDSDDSDEDYETESDATDDTDDE